MIFLRRALLLPLLLLAVSPGPAFAEPPPVTEELQGIWSRPDCATSEQVMIVSRHFVLAEVKQQPFLIRVESWRSEPFEENKLYLYTGTEGDQAVIRKTNDGLIKLQYKAAMPTQALHTLWGRRDEERATEYSRCVKLFDSRPGMTQDEVNIVFALDKMAEGCAGISPDQFPAASSCHAALFTAIDSNADAALDAEELNRAYRMTGFVKMAISSCSAVASDYPGTLVDEARAFVTASLAAFDEDGDKTLSLAETTARASEPTVYQGALYSFIENARNLQPILPFLPLPDVMKSCALNRREVQKYGGTTPLTEKPGTCPTCTKDQP